MSAETVATAVGALQVLHHETDGNRIAEANTWLTQLKQSSEAWEVAWALFQQPECPGEVQHFAIGLMRTGLLSQFATIGPEQWQPVKMQLYQLVMATAAGGSRPIITTACMLLSQAAIRAILRNMWTGVVAEVCETIQSQSQVLGTDQAEMLVLEFAKIFAQDISSSLEHTTAKTGLKAEITAASPQVLTMLSAVLGAPPSLSTEPALRCVEAWATASGGPTLPALETQIGQMLPLLAVPELREPMADVLCAIIKHGSSSSHPATIRGLLAAILDWRPVFDAAVASGDDDVVTEICRVVIVMGDSHYSMLLESQDPAELAQVNAFIEFVLAIFNHPRQYPTEETFSKQTNYFWYNLLDTLNDPNGPDELRDVYLTRYGQLFLPLLQVCHRKMQYPADGHELDPDEEALFRDYRDDIRDNICTVVIMLGAQCQATLISFLEASLATPEHWQPIESALDALRGSADTNRQDEAEYTPKLFAMLSFLPQHPRTLRTALQTIGAYAEWLQNFPEALGQAMTLLMGALTNADFARHAAVALVEICTDCGELLVPYIDPMLESCLASMQRDMRNKDRVKIVQALCGVISHLPADRALAETNRLLGSTIEQFNVAVGDPSTAVLIKGHLKLLSVACEGIRPNHMLPQFPHPVRAVLQSAWPGFRTIFTHWNPNEEIITTACDCLIHAARNLESLFSLFLDELVGASEGGGLITAAFLANPNASLFKLTSKIVNYFVNDTESDVIMYRLLTTLSAHVFVFFEASLREHPDIAKEYYDMLKIVIRRRVDLAFSDPALAQTLVQAALLGLQCPEHPTFKSACNLLKAIIEASKHNELARSTFLGHAPSLLDTLFKCVCGAVDRSLLDTVSRLFAALRRGYPEQVGAWTAELFAQESYPHPKVMPEHKQMFLTQINMGPKSLTETVTHRIITRLANVCWEAV